ncbi:hypothetical protein I2I11_04895 [Pontibacter sp. 172403-2]|uniref:hypothetical protein n=1 Tax=Pontibacter rufus TaxID=2791028 RepID=UPI0018AF810E|nr:hypothetical protein [Pontibacter sp. 172403-2]MBF9252620.1 hypothetical protein [Pontibacter sp. 172403-2]
MTRYLIEDEIITLLNLGKPVEAFIGRISDDQEILTWIGLEKSNENHVLLNIYEVFDEGNLDYVDIYDFSYVDPDLEFETTEFSDFAGTIQFIKERFKLNEINFLTKGGIQDEYKKLILAEGA